MTNKDLFEKTDEMVVEKVAQEFPVLTEEEKERIFAMSERKYNSDMNKENNNKFEDFNTDKNIEVKGVEQYKRPLWSRSLSIAAATVLMVGGVAGSMMLMQRGGRHVPATDIETTVPAEAATTTEAPTEANSEYMTAALDLTDKLAHYENILYNHDVDIDENDTLTFTIRNSEGEEHEETYARVADPEIQSGDDLKNAILALCTDEFKNELYTSSGEYDENSLIFDMCNYLYTYGYFINDFSGYKNNETINGYFDPSGYYIDDFSGDENRAIINSYYKTYGFITYNEKLYVCTNYMERDEAYYSSEPEIVSLSDDHFEASRMTVGYGINYFNGAQVGTKATFSFKKVDGEWKIDNIVTGRCVESWALAAVNHYFNYVCTDYSPDELDIRNDQTDDGMITTSFYDKLMNNYRILKNDSDNSCRIYCIIKDKEGNDYLEFTADVEFLIEDSLGFMGDEDYSEYFSFSNVTIKEIR